MVPSSSALLSEVLRLLVSDDADDDNEPSDTGDTDLIVGRRLLIRLLIVSVVGGGGGGPMGHGVIASMSSIAFEKSSKDLSLAVLVGLVVRNRCLTCMYVLYAVFAYIPKNGTSNDNHLWTDPTRLFLNVGIE